MATGSSRTSDSGPAPHLAVDVEPRKDTQTVTATGRPVQDLIDGVRVRPAKTITDERGTICEIYSPSWDFTEEPLIYAYQVTVRPGVVKGWVVHLLQDDRLFFSSGTAKVVLWDGRESSPTMGMINELYFDESNRGLLRIPRGVFHAVRNVGSADVLMVNLPTRPYDHENPDKYRLPRDTDAIPYEL
jgi:dTDP-4-dehydrorhamnose 3,5-epimerase